MTIPRLALRISSTVLLFAGVVLTLVGMFWLSRVDAADTYLQAVALPMLFIGARQGLGGLDWATAGKVARSAGSSQPPTSPALCRAGTSWGAFLGSALAQLRCCCVLVFGGHHGRGVSDQMNQLPG
jgi:hypothetical protein